MKNNESVTKLAQAIAELRKSGLTVTDETLNGGSMGIAGVRDREDRCAELEKPTKYVQAIAKMRASGLVVNDRTKKGGVIGIVGGVRLPAKKN